MPGRLRLTRVDVHCDFYKSLRLFVRYKLVLNLIHPHKMSQASTPLGVFGRVGAGNAIILGLVAYFFHQQKYQIFKKCYHKH